MHIVLEIAHGIGPNRTRSYPRNMHKLSLFKKYYIFNVSFSPFKYGFVFGSANLAAFIFAPIFGRFGSKIGPKLLYNVGAYVQGRNSPNS
jgi:MFS family permease